MEKALELYEDAYGQWRTFFELWRFSFLDEDSNNSKKYAEKLVKLPDDVTDEVAAASMLKGMTVEYLLNRSFKNP